MEKWKECIKLYFKLEKLEEQIKRFDMNNLVDIETIEKTKELLIEYVQYQFRGNLRTSVNENIKKNNKVSYVTIYIYGNVELARYVPRTNILVDMRCYKYEYKSKEELNELFFDRYEKIFWEEECEKQEKQMKEYCNDYFSGENTRKRVAKQNTERIKNEEWKRNQ